jgi:hypothetical protein
LCKDDSTFSECSYIALTILFLILLFSKVADVKREIVALEINSFLLSNIFMSASEIIQYLILFLF